MANTAASVLITKTLDNVARASTGITRSGETLENMGITWLNETMVEMAQRHSFKELLATSSGTAGVSVTASGTYEYTFPTSWKTIYNIRVINGTSSVRLNMESIDKFDRVYANPTDTGAPTIYAPFGNTFYVHPVPNNTYTMPIRYAVWPTVITAKTDLIDYEPDKDRTIIAGMTSKAFDYLQMITDADKWNKEFGTMLVAAIRNDQNTPDFQPQEGAYVPEVLPLPMTEYWNDEALARKKLYGEPTRTYTTTKGV